MRGKLRDKRAEGKRESFKNDVLERRRPVKRNSRTLVMARLSEQHEEEGYISGEEEAGVGKK